MAQTVKNNVFIKMTKTEINRLDVLCSIKGWSRPFLIGKLLDRAWKIATDSGELEDWLNSLASDDEKVESTAS